MKKFTETIADDDYRNSDGLLVCGRCGTPKEVRLSTELLGGHTAIVPIPCECMKRAEAERRERELAAERKRKIERARTELRQELQEPPRHHPQLGKEGRQARSDLA